ncbi:MAG: hypothetical protein A2W23_08685 [Planctomycetes bacterium RBG_16_43_13]|nr:MAG: hypothetical protein A2W23_08685 [Planctomycetes bacterium RBG_16_43_13]
MSESVNEAGIPNKLLFRPDEVAKIIGVTRQTVYNWIQEGKIQVCRTPGGQYRVLRGEVERILGERNND